VSDVKLLGRWTGWCDPCETERPLVLTETGERGVRAWLRGIGPEDRALTLTCGLCGEWQSVAYDEADDMEVAGPTSALVALQPLGAHSVTVRTAAFAPYPAEPIPAPRAATYLPSPSLELLPEDLELVSAR
jgi:hypothetical protein